jgi:hypothetical protein
VGFLSDHKEFSKRLKKILNIKIKFGHKNKGPVGPSLKAKVATPEVKKRIRKICEADIEIYEYALEKFGKAN